MDTPAFYIALFVHLISLVIGFGAVMVIDAFGALWLFRKMNVELPLVRRVAHITQIMIWIGFSGLVASGIPMILMKGHVDNLTAIKLFLVALVGLNGVALHFIKKSMDKLGQNAQSVPPNIFLRIGLATTVSQLGWWGATLIGFYHRHVDHLVDWPPYYVMIIGILAFVIGSAWTIGESATAGKTKA